MKRINIILLASSLFLSGSLFGQSIYPGQHSGKIKQPLTGKVKAYAFDLNNIKLLDSPFKANMERESEWILSLGVDQLLHSFRNTSGAYSAHEGGYSKLKKLGGWESLDCDLRGHSTGHIMSGLAYLYATTGNEKYKIKADRAVSHRCKLF